MNQEPDYQFSGQTKFYRGKVRDVYTIGQDVLVMVASNRISAFDVVLPRPIPRRAFFLHHATGQAKEELPQQAFRDVEKRYHGRSVGGCQHERIGGDRVYEQ